MEGVTYAGRGGYTRHWYRQRVVLTRVDTGTPSESFSLSIHPPTGLTKIIHFTKENHMNRTIFFFGLLDKSATVYVSMACSGGKSIRQYGLLGRQGHLSTLVKTTRWGPLCLPSSKRLAGGTSVYPRGPLCLPSSKRLAGGTSVYPRQNDSLGAPVSRYPPSPPPRKQNSRTNSPNNL